MALSRPRADRAVFFTELGVEQGHVILVVEDDYVSTPKLVPIPSGRWAEAAAKARHASADASKIELANMPHAESRPGG